MISPLSWLLVACALCASLRADFTADLVKIHLEASGGRAAVEGLRSIKATGTTRNPSSELKFILWAQRPNRIRTEVTSGTRTIAQGWDGAGEPWTADSQTRRAVLMRGVSADEFKADAQFDNPLLAGPEQRVTLEYDGKVKLDGLSRIKLVALQNGAAMSLVYLDPVSYLMVRRDIVRLRGEETVVIQTDYSDFKTVAGVKLPHRMVVAVDGKRVNETVITRIEPNPKLSPDLFRLVDTKP